MSPRKSSRHRTVTTKVQQQNDEKTNRAAHINKKRKLSSHDENTTKLESSSNQAKKLATPTKGDDLVKDNDRKIDPVEKLLSMTCVNNDILHMEDNDQLALSSSSSASASSPAYPNLSLNFNKLINDNLRSYYSKVTKSPMEIHNDNSSFSVLNKQPQPPQGAQEQRALSFMSQVPFFKNVNFNPSPSFGQRIDDYIYYDDEDEPLSTDSEHEEIATPEDPKMAVLPTAGKMSFRYRQNENVNFSLSDSQVQHQNEPNDIFKFMKKRSVISGKASEMIGTLNFMIHDFFF